MEQYFIFLTLAAVTVLSPGPGVLLTVSNSIRFGFTDAASGILGIAFGTFVVATVSATSLGLILVTSSLAFNTMKYIGAAYLIYLGIKMWRSPATKVDFNEVEPTTKTALFLEGTIIQVTNPKAVFFFMSVFPQFVDYSVASVVGQFSLLVFTYSALVVLIHVPYALMAKSARYWITTPKGIGVVNRIGGGTFICFGIGLATASKLK